MYWKEKLLQESGNPNPKPVSIICQMCVFSLIISPPLLENDELDPEVVTISICLGRTALFSSL